MILKRKKKEKALRPTGLLAFQDIALSFECYNDSQKKLCSLGN